MTYHLEMAQSYIAEHSPSAKSVASARYHLQKLAIEVAAWRDFIEEVAGSCIPDYEEAKADAQRLLAPELVNPAYVSEHLAPGVPRTDRFGRRVQTMAERAASGIEARSDATPKSGAAEGESPVAKPCAQKDRP